MIVEELATPGRLLFLKRLKESNENYDAVFDEIQQLLLEKEFSIQIVDGTNYLMQVRFSSLKSMESTIIMF